MATKHAIRNAAAFDIVALVRGTVLALGVLGRGPATVEVAVEGFSLIDPNYLIVSKVVGGK